MVHTYLGLFDRWAWFCLQGHSCLFNKRSLLTVSFLQQKQSNLFFQYIQFRCKYNTAIKHVLMRPTSIWNNEHFEQKTISLFENGSNEQEIAFTCSSSLTLVVVGLGLSGARILFPAFTLPFGANGPASPCKLHNCK